MEFENLLAVLAGGCIGFLSGYGMEAIKRRWNKRETKRRIARLIEILYEEVEQLAELIEIDLGWVENTDIDFTKGFHGDLREYEIRLRDTIKRLQENRTIFDSQANHLLELPEYVPNALVRFYSRLHVNCGRMLACINDSDIERIREIREQLRIEAQSLKIDLKKLIEDQ